MSISPKDSLDSFEKRELIREAFMRWVEPLTIHGIPSMVRTRYTLFRIMWLVAFLLSTFACVYAIVLSVFGYLDYEVVTKIKSEEETTTIFPQVSNSSTNNIKTNQTNFIFISRSSYATQIHLPHKKEWTLQ
jgi:hypothetical protein